MSVFPSNSIPIFILLCFTILFHIPNVTAYEVAILDECSSGETYESGSQFQTNLEFLLDSLVANGSQDGYFNTSVGESPDIVYGLAQCRGDLSKENCRSCLNTAEGGIIEYCANGMSATLRYERCMLRYSYATFFSQRSASSSWSKYLLNITDEYLDPFSEKLEVLMKNLSNNAVSTPTRFSFGQTDYAQSQVLYGAAQCTRDLSQSDCEGCLELLYSSIPSCCNASRGASIASETCYIQYQIEKFVEGSPGSPPTFSPVYTRVSNRTFFQPKQKISNGNDGGKSFKVLYIIVAIIASIMLE